MPTDPWERAKVRELIQFLELHLERVARRLYPQAFFGGKVSQGTLDKTRPELERNIVAFGRLAKFGPFLAGERETVLQVSAERKLDVERAAREKSFG